MREGGGAAWRDGGDPHCLAAAINKLASVPVNTSTIHIKNKEKLSFFFNDYKKENYSKVSKTNVLH